MPYKLKNVRNLPRDASATRCYGSPRTKCMSQVNVLLLGTLSARALYEGSARCIAFTTRKIRPVTVGREPQPRDGIWMGYTPASSILSSHSRLDTGPVNTGESNTGRAFPHPACPALVPRLHYPRPPPTLPSFPTYITLIPHLHDPRPLFDQTR